MSLLTDFVAGSLDPSYAAAAARRRAAAADDPPVESARELRRPAVVLTAVLVGVLFAVSWSNVQATTSVVSRARAQLIEQITQRQQHGDDTAQTIQQLRAEIARARASALTTAGQGTLLGQISTLEQAAAAQAVRGPGVVVTLDDAPGSDDAGQQRGGSAFSKNRVQAADLQLVVNGLWAAGAEAIAVNDQRLTSRSAIRFAGEAILVDFRPLARPYAVVALGNPTTMASGLGTSAVGSYLKSLTDNYGIRVTVTSSSTLSCPAGPLTDLRHAQTGTGGIPSSGAATSTPPPTTRPTSTSRSTSKATRR